MLRRLAAVIVAAALSCAGPGWAVAEVLWEGRVQMRDGRWLTVSKQLVDGRAVTLYSDENGRPLLESELSEDAPRRGPARVSPALTAVASGPSASRSVPILVTLRDQPTAGIAADVKAIFDPYVDRQVAALTTARERHRTAAPAEQPAREQDVHNAGDVLKQMMAARRQVIGRRAQAIVPVLQAGVRQHLAALGGTVTHAYALRNMLAVRLPAAMIPVLALHPDVADISEDAQMTALLDTSTASIGAPTWWSNGTDGAGPWDVGVLDTGMDLTNPGLSAVPSQSGVFLATGSTSPEFGDNVASADDLHSHGTHTGGIVVSRGAPGFVNHKGVAFGAGIINLKAGFRTTGGSGYMFNSDAMAAVEWAAFTAASPADVLSLSFGGCSTASDSSFAQFWDSVVDELGIPVAIAAGNSGPSNQTTTVGGCPPPAFTDPALAYNILSVGAMSDLGTTDRGDDVVASYSSRGPVPGGRKKPDLMAPGSSIVSTSNTWETGADYVSKSGTSMAAPHIAGALALLLDGGVVDAKALKAVLINSAQDLGTTGWSGDSGWGYTDLTAAFMLRSSYFLGSMAPRGQPGSVKFYRGSLGAGERATLVWNRNVDYRGTQSAIAFALNDLDLTLYQMSDGGVVAASASAIDNVEQVRVGGATSGLVLKVGAVSTAFNGVSTEAYALATGSGIVEASGPTLAVSLSAPAQVGPGAQFSTTATASNTGDLTAHANCVTLALPAGFSVVSGSNPQCVGSIAPGAQGMASWTVQAAAATGPYGLSATDASTSYGESFSSGAGSGTVTVTEAPALPVVTIVASDPTATEEGLTTGAFTVSRTGSTAAALTVSWSITGTAVKNVDRQPVPAAPTIPAGASSVVVTVTPLQDTLVEGPETVIATLTAGSGYTVGSPSTATVTIEDNDVALPVVTIAASDATATEAGPTTGTFTISRTGATTAPLTVLFAVGGTASSSDRQALPSSVTIPVGASSVPLVVTPVDDSVAESNETVVVTLSANAAYRIGSPTSATVTIVDDDTALPVVTIVASDPIATEAGLTTGSFTLSRTGPTTSSLTVTWTVTGTAVKNVDRLPVPAAPTIPAGASSLVITVTPLQDTLVEGDETITATLGASGSYIVGSPSTATVTIVDDD